VILEMVGHRFHRRESDIDLRLPGRRDLVMLPFNWDASPLEFEAHLVANVLQTVGWSDRKVAFFCANLVTEIGKFLAGAVPMGFRAVDEMEGGIASVVVTDFVENEKLGFRPKEGRVGNTGALEICFRFFGDTARIAIVRLACDRIDDRADEAEGRLGVNYI